MSLNSMMVLQLMSGIVQNGPQKSGILGFSNDKKLQFNHKNMNQRQDAVTS
jgi:hypothetical protein